MSINQNVLQRGFTVAKSGKNPVLFTTELFSELAEIDLALGALNREDPNKGFFEYLSDISGDNDLGTAKNILASLHLCLRNHDAQQEMLNVSTQIIGDAFAELYAAAKDKLPTTHMSYVLNKVGLPILPQTKLGWRHTTQFNCV